MPQGLAAPPPARPDRPFLANGGIIRSRRDLMACAGARRALTGIMLSFAAWNVWYRTRRRPEDRPRAGLPVAPPLSRRSTRCRTHSPSAPESRS
jgi:hypothetical protein